MPRNVLLTDEQKATIAEEATDLLATGMAAYAVDDVLGVKFGLNPRTIRQCRNGRKLLMSGLRPLREAGDDETDPLADIGEDDPNVKGTSTLYGNDGAIKLKWVKTHNKFNREQFEEWAEALAADLPKAEAVNAPDFVSDDTLTVIPFGDPHLGLHSWAAETGDDFDLKIAERDLCAAVDRLVKCVPRSRQALIANLGDYFHADNLQGETMRSHHKLDTDTRWAKVLLVGLKAIRQCISSALEHHEQVTVINAIGNHDDHSSIFLTIALANIYENETRVTIVNEPTVTHYYHFGKNLIGVHHGHSIKAADLPLIMAADRPKEWGETKHRLWLCGHIHHDTKKEIQGVIVETFRTLAARDAWAASKGYRSGRDMKALVIHREFGEVARHVVSVDMLRTANE